MVKHLPGVVRNLNPSVVLSVKKTAGVINFGVKQDQRF